MISLKRKIAALIAGLALLAVVTGCGVDTDEAPESAGATGSAATFQEPTEGKTSEPVTRATPRNEGTIRIAGKAQGSLTERLVSTYELQGGNASVTTTGGNEQTAFDAFCAGQNDIVDSARPISPGEYRQCIARGIQPVQFQIASDAAVLAIKNETDVGVDCLSFDEVRNIFQAGSGINTWAQVGYDHDVTLDASAPRMKVAGPDEDSNVFSFFGQYVLGDDEPTLLSVRGDYQAYSTDAGVRRAVVGTNRDSLAAQEFAPSQKVFEQIIASIADAKQAVKDAEDEKAKGIRDKRSKSAKERDQRILDNAEKTLKSLKTDTKDSRRYVRANRDATRRIESVRGTMGLFRFSYYEAFEEQLRPMEVSSSNDFRKPECIFPSQATVTNATYPLSRQLLLTVNLKNMNDSDINDFLTSALANSQKQAEEAALVPLPDEVQVTEQDWLDGTSQPDIIFYDIASMPAKQSNKQAAEGE
ncbi:MAG: substrate-binding domain-containing protein [Thermoleophilia bacterium]|nr:substrate-binding domain-containing protein [Thermoleophilia bacterium]